MKFQTLMIIKAVVCLLLGVPILLMPDFMYSIFGITLGPGAAVAAREYGAALIGTLLITWFARNAAGVRRALGYCPGLLYIRPDWLRGCVGRHTDRRDEPARLVRCRDLFVLYVGLWLLHDQKLPACNASLKQPEE